MQKKFKEFQELRIGSKRKRNTRERNDFKNKIKK